MRWFKFAVQAIAQTRDATPAAASSMRHFCLQVLGFRGRQHIALTILMLSPEVFPVCIPCC